MISSNTFPKPQQYSFWVKHLQNNCRYLRGLETAELKEEDMSMV
jgi:hypothetical protein